MTAARLGDPEGAIEALLLDQPETSTRPTATTDSGRNRIPIYLPANGGALGGDLVDGRRLGRRRGRRTGLPEGRLVGRGGRGLHALALSFVGGTAARGLT